MAWYPPPGMAGPRLISAWGLRTQTERVDVTGLEHVPAAGPVLIVAHHYHHLLDGAVVTLYVPRPVHIVVGLDWAANAAQRRWMERACRWAQYPVVLRPATVGASAAYAPGDVARYLRSGVRDAAALLRADRVVLVFPEGYPVVDPAASATTPRNRDADGFLPFARGFRAIGRLSGVNVPIVPLGFGYARTGRRWRIAARFGPALPLSAPLDEIARTVRALSTGATPSRS